MISGIELAEKIKKAIRTGKLRMPSDSCAFRRLQFVLGPSEQCRYERDRGSGLGPYPF